MIAAEAGDNVGMRHVAPALGTVIANVMFLSPLVAVLGHRRIGSLGELNPLPFPLIFANCLGWLAYSFVLRDYYVFFSNAPGCLLGLYFTLSAIGLAGRRERVRLESITMVIVGIMVLTGLVTVILPVENPPFPDGFRKTYIGGVAVAMLVMYYAAPLSVLYHVIATRSAAALNTPLALASLANSLLWTAYGIAISDLFILCPNAVVRRALTDLKCIYVRQSYVRLSQSSMLHQILILSLILCRPRACASVDGRGIRIARGAILQCGHHDVCH